MLVMDFSFRLRMLSAAGKAAEGAQIRNLKRQNLPSRLSAHRYP
jgi:hypothetical protein